MAAGKVLYVQVVANISGLSAKLGSAAASVNAFGTEVDKAGLSTAALEKRADSSREALGGLGVIVGGAVVAAFLEAGKQMADFDAKMALVQTLAHANAAEMGQLRQAALTAGQAYGFTAGQVADAEAELVKAGVSVKDIMGGALTGALTLAAAGQENVAEATETAAIAITQFKLQGKDVPHVADLLAAGADKALGSVGDLSAGLQSGGLVAHQFGLSIEDTIGTLSAFAQAGLLGQRGGTTLRQMLLQLAAPSSRATKTMNDLGISVYNAQGKFIGITALAGVLHDKLGSLTQAQRNNAEAVIFGTHAINGANVLYEEGAKGIQAWITKVNASGFAALQASGKMNSLTGDATKLKQQLNVAFISAGEGANGPLRDLVQELTAVISAWNNLPAPVKSAMEAMTGVAGVTALAAGAALLAIPKYRALDVALTDMSGGAVTAGGALTSLGKAAGIAAALIIIYEAANKLADAFAKDAPSINAVTSSLLSFNQTGKISGQTAVDFGKNLSGLGPALKQVADPSIMQSLTAWSRWDPVERIAGVGANLAKSQGQVKSYDAALSGLVTGGHASVAASFFDQISQQAAAQGISVGQLAKIFPQYSAALSTSANSAKAAGTGIDQYGNAVGDAAQQTAKATAAAKSYSDALHALTDPLFAMNQALQGLKTAQDAAKTATDKYGASSHQAKQANLDLASSALDAETAAHSLSAAVKDGSVSLSDARSTLHAWVKAGLLTESQADAVAKSFGGLISQAQALSRQHPHVKVSADVTAAMAELARVKVALAGIGHGVMAHVGISPSNYTKHAAGTEDHRAQVAPAGAMRLWAEPETGGEAYIPLASSKRGRSMGILGSVAKRFGARLVPNANGNVWTFDPTSSGGTTFTDSGTIWSNLVQQLTKTKGGKTVTGKPTLKQFEDSLNHSAKDADRWQHNLTTIARRAGEGVSDELAAMGQSGAKQVALMAGASHKQLMRMVHDLNQLQTASASSIGTYTAQMRGAYSQSKKLQTDLAKLAAQGYTALAEQLEALGGPQAEQLAAGYLKHHGAARKANTTAGKGNQLLTADQQTELLEMIGALRAKNGLGIHDVAAATGLDEDEIITVADLDRADLRRLGAHGSRFLSDLQKANNFQPYELGGYARPGSGIRWNEAGTGGEYMIPGGRSHKARSLALLQHAADRFGYSVMPHAMAASRRSAQTLGRGGAGPAIGQLTVQHRSERATAKEIVDEAMWAAKTQIAQLGLTS